MEQPKRANLDRLINSIGAAAEMQRFHFEELRRQGFTRKEAFELVKVFTAGAQNLDYLKK